MEKHKSKVIKSKSSNSAITTKSDNQRNKKSRSNAEFQILMAKKRGVYVEKKPTEVSLTNTANSHQKEVKPPPPRPGRKTFLASVLTILSKSTTGTQYPDTEEKVKKSKKKALKDSKNDSSSNNDQMGTTVEKISTHNVEIDAIATNNDTKGTNREKKGTKNAKTNEKRKSNETGETEKKKKQKYKSKVLNDNKNKVDRFEVLQSKKEITQTPSMYSDTSYIDENFKWSDILPRLVKNVDEEEEKEKIVNNNLVKEVVEGRKAKDKKVRLVDDPSTLVSDVKDDKIYNFFVDLLETTFSVYNVKADFDAAKVLSAVSSKAGLEIEECVVKKLNEPRTYDDVTQKPSKRFYCINTTNQSWQDEKLRDYFQSMPSPSRRSQEQPLKSAKRKKIKSESYQKFSFMKENASPTSRSAVMTQKRSFYKKNNKKNLLNLLKEELKMESTYEEPQNLYQALKVMAKNKRKYQKSIRFDRTAKPDDECMFTRRKVISPSTKSSSKYKVQDSLRYTKSISHRPSEYSGYQKRKYAQSEYTTDEEMSNHSLEVYGYDYEYPAKKTMARRERELLLTYHSSPSESDAGYQTLLKYDSGSDYKF